MHLRATSAAGACHQLQCDDDCFLALLDLAEDHGWKPNGTFTPLLNLRPDPSWSGTYYPAAGQYITPADAANIADALERALHAIHWTFEPPLALDTIKEFIALCRDAPITVTT
jgi:hypothetical protein